MTLHIQDPTDVGSEYLIDTLLDACDGATRGAGAFAFLSAGGVRMFLKDEGFVNFAQAGAFDLVVGIDAITDTSAIAELDAAKTVTPTLGTSVHIPKHPSRIFHPKIAWFEKKNSGVLITGSGNLTAGGLRWNIEAFSVTTLSKAEVNALSGQWNSFKARSADCLFPTSDPRVVARLEQNAERGRADRLRQPQIPEPLVPNEPVVITLPEAQAEEAANVDALPQVIATSDVLLAEIPKSGTRWKQANFNEDTFINFFGASTTIPRVATFFHVRPDGTIGQQERRPAVVVASHNYRFELEAASGLPYPATGRPIGVFVRIATRTFTYMLVMPGDIFHIELTQLLQNSVPAPGREMRRFVFPAQQVKNVWPSSPLWNSLTI